MGKWCGMMCIAGAIVVMAALAGAQEPDAERGAEPPRFLVIIPEQIDTEWFWCYYTEVSQNIVQTRVEKALVRAGLNVIDLTTVSLFSEAGTVDQVLNRQQALRAAADAGAVYLVLGQATAVMQSRSKAYGQEVIRSQAEVTVRIIRVADGKMMGVYDAEAVEGGQAQKAAGQQALKTVAKQISRRVAGAAQKLEGESE